MQTDIQEIADGVFRFSTLAPAITPDGFTFNQFLIQADEPLLFHCGPRGMFPLVSEAVAKVVPLARLRWISFGHVESDECGSMNAWLAAAPNAEVVHGELACNVSLNDLADRPPRALADGAVLDLGGRSVRLLHTPHVPHGWEAIALFEQAGKTLLCGDILTNAVNDRVVADDVVGPALAMEQAFHAMSMAPNTGAVLERLAALEPTTLAIMHGASYRGDGAKALRAFAAGL